MAQEAENVLLVEGPNDTAVLSHLLSKSPIAARLDLLPHIKSWPVVDEAVFRHRLRLKQVEGVSTFLNFRKLLNELRNSDLQRIGLVVDTDQIIEQRWQSLRDVLARCGYSAVPPIPEVVGTVVEPDDVPDKTPLPRLGIWVMTDNILPGKLEHFVQTLVPLEDKLWAQAESCLQAIPNEQRLFSEPDTIKAHVHTWLAWQKEPGLPIGLAITKSILNPHATTAQTFLAWVSRLFELDAMP